MRAPRRRGSLTFLNDLTRLWPPSWQPPHAPRAAISADTRRVGRSDRRTRESFGNGIYLAEFP